MSAVHRVRLPVAATPLVEVGHRVEPAEVLAMRRPPGEGAVIEVAARLRRSAADAEDLVRANPGSRLAAGGVLASDGRGREVTVDEACLFLGYDRDAGTALVAPLGPEEPIIGHVRGDVADVGPAAIEIRVAGALVAGVGGIGEAVHGEIAMAVGDPAEELRAGAIDVGARGRILVGGSRASAETLTRARAMGVAGIVLGGMLDKDLRDFEAARARRRELAASSGSFALMIVGGYGKVALDDALFAWFARHAGHLGSLFGTDARLYVYDADPAPGRRSLPRTGDRVVANRRPYAGAGGELVAVRDEPHATPAGIVARSGIVRFDDGRTAVVPLANLVAVERRTGG